MLTTPAFQERFSPQDKNGYKHIYICLVSTGEYTKGTSDMIVPPPENPTKNKAILYDSLADNGNSPTKFVAVNDNQAYPQYLMACKMS